MTKDPQPATASAWRAEGEAHIARSDFDAALHCFESALALDPADAVNHERLAATLTALTRYSEAAERYREAIARDPLNADLHHGLGWTLELMHQLEEAIDAYREAVRHNPRADGSNNNIGNCLQALGRFDEAHEAYRRAIAVAPRVPLYYRNFVQTKRLAADDPVFASLQELVADAASLGNVDRAETHFAYGQALSDLGRHDESFDHQLKGNALHRAGVGYNEADTLGLFAHMPALMNADVLAAARGLGDPSAAPVFIVGMPRSGSTLIEQVLASHPQVFGAGERTEFGEALVRSICRPAEDPLRIGIETMEQAGAEQLRALGGDYLSFMHRSLPEIQREASGDTPRYSHFTDKYPFNFINVGLIHLALPNARFIHSSRSPLQTCLSIFSRIFHDVPFGYDLGELGRYYRAYDTLMKYWHSVLPEGVMIEVKYEDLVDDFEGNVRRMLAHCGLEWDERCLAFHQNTRQVNTASSAQVRQPIYKTSVRRWQPEASLLKPLVDGLGPELASADHVIEQHVAAAAVTATGATEKRA